MGSNQFPVKTSAFYKLLTESEVGEYHHVPQGNRTKKASISSLNNKNFGPIIKYQQHDLPACIYYSLANACTYIGENVAATKLFDVFQDKMIDKSYNPKFSEATLVMKNHFHIRPQTKNQIRYHFVKTL